MAASDSVTLAWTPSSAAEARRFLGAGLRHARIAEGTVSDAVLVVSELVGNAVRHATPIWHNSLEVAWRLGDEGLRIEVTDGGSASLPVLRDPQTDDLGGRGLALVEALSLRWGVLQGPETSTVWSLLQAETLHDFGTGGMRSAVVTGEASYSWAN